METEHGKRNSVTGLGARVRHVCSILSDHGLPSVPMVGIHLNFKLIL